MPRPLLPALLAAVALGAAAVEAPDAVRSLSDSLRADPGGATERELAPAEGLDVPEEVLIGAERAIPRSAVYAVVVGENLELSESQHVGIPQLLHYWLLPRRWTTEVDEADWVIAYGESGETLGVPVEREVELAEAVVAAKVGR